MAYILKLNGKDGNEKTYVRNGEPNLRDITNALKVQYQQLKMDAHDTPTNEETDANEANLARFAVDFWQRQFTIEEVVWGATRDSLGVINDAIIESLGLEEETGAKSQKKSQRTTSRKTSTKSTTSTKTA